eukprot:2620415-Alexandrium_andersonii.AAC.1
MASVPRGRSSGAVAPRGLLVMRCAAAPSAPARTTFRDHAPIAVLRRPLPRLPRAIDGGRG